ncbi:MAG: TonB-dependent receptor [Cellvibrio sp.]|uniref:TonB-dependent receptor n=1 Tax=Cellvibrio sp. TaxID=1965322 RepID=UPI0031A10DC7
MRLNYTKKALVVAMALVGAQQAVGQQNAQLDEIIVTGTRGALINALERQRDSDKVASVVDSDSMGNFADINVAESLRRVSGVMVENDQGEGRYVSVRGMNTDLNAMTINGVSTASPENRRGIMLDGVPTDMLESMTVYKTLTPNLDADTIGGAIDLETISAFKFDGLHARVKAETSYSELSKDSSNPKLALIATNRFQMADGELGVALTLSDQTRRIVSKNNETGGWGEEAINTDYEMRYYDLERERQGAVLNFDYHANSGNKYYARFFHNEYTETEDRAKWEVRKSMEEDAVVEGNIATFPFQRVDTESRPRVELRSISSAQFGGEFQLSDRTTLKAEIFGSEAEQDDTNKWNVVYRSKQLNTPLTYDNSNPRKPVLNFDPALYDAANYKLNAFESEYALTQDQDVGIRADLTFELSDSTEIQYGAKYRARQKDNDFNFCGYSPVEDSTLAEHPYEIIGNYMNNRHGPAPTAAGARALIDTLGTGVVTLSDGTSCRAPGDNWEMSGDEDAESIAADWYTDEDILSGYLMATTKTDKVTYIYGVRYEETKATYNGKQFDGEAFAGNVSYDNDYGFVAPSLNIKIDLADDKLMRVGLFRSLVRPGFGESAAGAEIDLEDNEIKGGNPFLDPTTAWNLDLSYEWYISRETFLSAGVFHKEIDDAILAVEAADINLRGQLWDRGETYINADGSSITGFELGFQTAFENGFLVLLNYTYADGTTDLPADSAYGVRSIPYFKQAEHTGNVSFGYNKGDWDIRLAANYRSEYLDAIGGGALYDRYASDHVQLDLTAKYQFSEKLAFNAAAINLNDRPEYYYFGNKSRLSQYDEFGATYEVGVSYTF